MRDSYQVLMAVILSFSSYAVAYGEEIRDYYAEPGLNPFKETLNQDLNEHIDPFSGTLQHRYVDVHVPGNGGLDLKVTRVYTSPQEALGVRTVTGAGWTMHFGRVVIPTDYTDTLCLQDLYAVSTKDNPSIEFPDGGRELLVLDAVHGTYLITKSGWRALCNGSGQGLILTSPTGTVYTMDALNTLNNHWSWYTTHIRDRHGNTIDITYKTNASNFIYIDTVTASDGRQVKFEYLDEESAFIRLDKITANEQTWTYRYGPIEAIGPGYGDNYHNLTEVIRPDGLRWRYSYYPYTSPDTAGNYALKTVTYPYGANITYAYQHIDFTPDDLSIDRTTAIATKDVSGNPPGIISVGPGSSLPSGTWRFEFEPHSPELFFTDKGTWTSGLDKTTVRMPGGKQVYYHYGYSYTGGLSSGILWATGLLYKQETRDGCSAGSCAFVGSTLVDEVTNGWEPRLISHENFWHGREGLDEDTYVPQLARQVHSRDDSGNEIRYEHYDAFGNAGRIIESSNIAGDPDKVTELSYYIDREKWILHQLEDETILGENGEAVSHTDRSFNEDGDLIATDENGVLRSYTYTPEGDLASATDARGSTTRYASYHRGSAQLEEHPESVTLARVVNGTGTVASQTNGRGFTRNFTYDGTNRLTGITYPTHAPVSIVWDASGKTLTRGSYEERITLDGFGRVVSTTRADTALGISITQTMKYDVHSNKIFESYPSSEAGVSYAYDLLKRPTTLQHPDGAQRSYVYGGGEVTETDERGNSTNYLYRSFGDPDKGKVLVQIIAPNNLYTILDYNLLNLPTEVFQGELNPADGSISGYTRELSYDSRYFLTSVSDPETGVTAYGRDEVGNMISHQVGSSGVTAYSYDTLNRQVLIDYPGATPDVTKRYDADGHLTKLTNSHAVIDQRYDKNDNLIEKVLTLDAVPYALNFTYNALDVLATLTYPSGRVVDYLPDAFGRPTQAAPYLSGVSYHPSGQLARINYANGELTDITLNERQWISEFLHHGLAELHYAYDALGNVLGLSDPLNPAEDRAFGYDALNRLTSAQGRWGAGSFEYDAFGNLTLMAQGADSHVLDYNALRLRSVIHNNTTRTWYTHDAYGNVRYDTEILGTGTSGALLKDQQYVYDDAGHLRSVPVSQYLGGTLSISTHSFDYDAAGNRMRRTGPNGEVTGFVYGRTGQLLGEYTGATTYGKEYIYLGSQQIASAETNAPPVADAGADRDANIGQVVTLDGSKSSDPDGSIASYAWTQVSGTAVSLTAADTARPTFTAPPVAVDTAVSFQLTVTDSDLASASDTVSVRISANRAPIAAAGPDQRAVAGQTVVLDGSGSSDPDGSSLTYLWTQSAGYGVTLDDRTTPKPAFTLATSSTAATLQFKLTVTDPSGLSTSDSVAIAVLDLITDGDNDGLPDGWEIIHFGSTSLYEGSADPDGDGLSNAQEYSDGTDPLTPEPAPTAVSDLWAVPGEGEITLEWTPVPAAASYDLYWSTSPGVTPVNGNQLTEITRPYLHTGRSNGTPYYYIVVAANNSGAAPASMEVSATPGTRRWQAAIPIGSAEDMAVTTRGERMLIWQTGKTLWARYYRGSWRAPQALHAGAGPVGDPKIALDERGHAMAVWREHDGTRWNLWSRIYQLATGVWESPVLVETYNGSVYEEGSVDALGHLVMNAAGQAVVTWTQERIDWYSGTRGIYTEGAYLNYYRPGQGWRGRDRLDPFDVGESEAPAVDLDPAGRYVAAWMRAVDLDGPDSYLMSWHDQLLAAHGDRSATKPSVRLDSLPDTGPGTTIQGTDVSLNGAGQAEVVWSQLDKSARNASDEIRLRRFDFAATVWTASEILGPRRRGNTPYGLTVSRNAQGQGVLAWAEAGDIVARYAPSLGTWASATVLGSGTHPQTGLDAGGQAFVAWYDAGSSPTVATARYVPASGWDRAVILYTGMDDEPLALKRFIVDPGGNARLLWQGGILARLSDYAVVAPASPANTAPTANAGPDKTYAGGISVVLDGSGSTDPGGDHLAYHWTQISGPLVQLNSTGAGQPSFTAPYVAAGTPFVFALTLSDPYGVSSAEDTVTVTVQPNSNPADTTPPVTSAPAIRKNGKITTYTVSLNPNEVASTYFRLTGAASFTAGAVNSPEWQIASGPLTIAVTGTAALEYASIDAAGNSEALQSMTLK